MRNRRKRHDPNRTRPISSHPLVSVTIASYKDTAWIEQCIESVRHQSYRNIELLVWDNAATDGAASVVTKRFPGIRVIVSRENIGFSKAHNALLTRASGEFALLLNSDVVLEKHYVQKLVEMAQNRPTVAALTGKLLLMSANPGDMQPPRIDSTGYFPLRGGSYWDRGERKPDSEIDIRSGEVFGVSAAAALYRMEALRDVAENGDEVLDETFFMYGEDVDLAYRLQWRGWTAYTVVDAIAWHARELGNNAARVRRPSSHNYHFTKNRYLILLKNLHAVLFFRNAPALALWSAGSVAYAVLFERSSLGALVAVLKMLPTVLNRRRAIMRGRRVSVGRMLQWYREGERLRGTSGARRSAFVERAAQLWGSAGRS